MTEMTHGRVLRIAGPIVLSNATVPLLGAVDTAVIGQLGDPASLGAVGIGAVILATLYWAFGFLRMSTSGLAAQAQGAGDLGERSAVLLRALIVGVGAGLVLVVAQTLLFAAAFSVAPGSDEVEALAHQYLAIRIWGAPATIALYALTGWLIGLERTRGVLVLQLWQNGLNVGLDLWFVLGLGWGVPGVAFATLIAEWTGLMLALWLARDAFGPVLREAWARLGDRVAMRRMFSASRDIMARTILSAAVVHQLCLPWRAVWRRDAGGQPGADAVPGDHGLCAGRLRLRGRGSDRPSHRHAVGGADPGGRAHLHAMGVRRGSGAGAGLCADRACDHRSDDHLARGARGGAGLPALAGRRPADRGRGLDLRRHLHRRASDRGTCCGQCCCRSLSTSPR